MDNYWTALARVDPDRLRELIEEQGVRELLITTTEAEVGTGESRSGLIVHQRGLIHTASHPDLGKTEEEVVGKLATNAALSFLASNVDRQIFGALARNPGFPDLVARIAEAVTIQEVVAHRRIRLSNGESHPFRLTDDDGRSAILAIDETDLPVVPIATAGEVDEADAMLVGYPSVAIETSRGWQLTHASLDAGWIELKGEAPVSRGFLGGPVVSAEGTVTGALSAGKSVTSDLLEKLPARNLPEREGETAELLDAAVLAAERGSFSESEKLLAEAAERFPGSPDIIRAIAGVRRAQDSRTALVRTWTMSAILLAALLAALLLLRRHSRLRRVSSIEVLERREIHPFVFPARTHETRGGDVDLGGFTLLSGSGRGTFYALRGPGIRAGRDPRICEVVLDDPRISRVHAEFQLHEDEVMLIDNGSSNGTWVNGKQIERAILREGDIIHFGGPGSVGAVYSYREKNRG